jgi:type IV pilus assembly protein PilW
MVVLDRRDIERLGAFSVSDVLKQLPGVVVNTNADGTVDTWDNTTPTTNADWLKVMAVRIAVVARSTQFEKSTVTFADPQWDLGANGTVTGSTACGANRCLPLKVSHLADWGRYRYRVFETIVPLRNMLWN